MPLLVLTSTERPQTMNNRLPKGSSVASMAIFHVDQVHQVIRLSPEVSHTQQVNRCKGAAAGERCGPIVSFSAGSQTDSRSLRLATRAPEAASAQHTSHGGAI